MNRIELREYGDQALCGARRAACNRENTRLAGGNFTRGFRNGTRMRRRHDHRAMPIGMHEIAIVHGHAEYGDFVTEVNRLGVRVRCGDRPARNWNPGAH